MRIGSEYTWKPCTFRALHESSRAPAPLVDVALSELGVIIVAVTFATIFPDGNFDALTGKGFAEFGGFDDTRKLLGRENCEGRGK